MPELQLDQPVERVGKVQREQEEQGGRKPEQGSPAFSAPASRLCEKQAGITSPALFWLFFFLLWMALWDTRTADNS